MTDLPPIERLQAVDLRPGDTVIVTLPDHVTSEFLQRASVAFKKAWPKQQVLVVSAGVEIEVHRPEP